MSKNVALSNEVIEFLEQRKKSDESYSDVIKRLTNENEKPSWRESIGAFENDEEAARIFDKILKERHIARKRRVLKW